MGEDQSPTRRRVTVAEAADILGITVEAVRGRIKRDTLEHEKADDGTVYVLFKSDQARPASDQSSNRSTDQALIMTRLENEVQFLREELARKDAILLNMTEAMKALTPPSEATLAETFSEPPQAPEMATEQPGRVEPQLAVEGDQEGKERRSWWSRMVRRGLGRREAT